MAVPNGGKYQSYHVNLYKDGLTKKTPLSNTKSEADTRVPVIEIPQIQTHLPYFQSVPAGFPSPADDYAEEHASCDQVFNPKLRGRPIVVLSNKEGCVVAHSNKARALGIPMGEPFFKIEILSALFSP